MKQGKTGATGRRGPKGAPGVAGAPGRRGGIGKPGRQGLKGLTGTLVEADALDQVVMHFEDIYQQLSSQATRIAKMQHQLDEIEAALKTRH